MPDSDNPLPGPSKRPHLKFNKDVLPEFRRRPESWDDDDRHAAQDRVATRAETDSLLKWAGIAILIIALSAVVAVVLRGGEDEVVAPAAGASASAQLENQLERAKEVAAAYLASTTVDDRLAYVRRRGEVRPLMEAYYDENELYGLKVWSFVRAGQRWSYGGLPFWEVVANTPDGEESMILEQIGDDFKVDWETQVGLNPMDPAEYLRLKPDIPMDFRVRVSADAYYNGPFSDAEEYLAARLQFANSKVVVFGYIQFDSPFIGRFKELVEVEDGRGGSGGPVELILRLQWPAGAREAEAARLPQLHVREIVSERWLKID